MKKIIAILMAAALVCGLGGCGKVDRKIAAFTGYSTICVDGVTYLQFTSGAAVKYDQQGNVVKC